MPNENYFQSVVSKIQILQVLCDAKLNYAPTGEALMYWTGTLN